jgi:guanine deaminase
MTDAQIQTMNFLDIGRGGPDCKIGFMKAWRASLLRFDDDGRAAFDTDGLLVTGPDATGRRVVIAAGDHGALVAGRFPGVPVTHLPGRILAPGFLDLHIHYPQTDVIGSPAEGLLPWLERYTFPHEARFADAAYAADVATFFLDELARNGVTTALTFATSHPTCGACACLPRRAQRGMRLITGKVLQDRHSPDGVRDQTEQSLIDTEALIHRVAWRGPSGLRDHPALCAELQRGATGGRGRVWRRATRMSGSSPMWRRTSMKCAGRVRCFRRRARIWLSMATMG